MSLFKQIRVLLRARRAGASLGELGALKFDMLGGSTRADHQRLRSLGLAELDVDMAELRRLPDGSVGREYARMLDDRGLEPLTIGPAVKQQLAERPTALRYITTHDLFHVLTGFSTHPAGEMGLFAFMIAQGFAGGSRWRLWSNGIIYCLLLPLHTRGILHNARLGLAMGERARNLLEQPLDEMLTLPLPAARRRLGLPDPADIDLATGHRSWLYDRLFALGMKPKAA